jgi:sec-independent protein translocase protein TatB
MFGIGLPEMLVILAVALIVVGPDKLPGLARSLARTLLELKKTAESMKNEFMAENPLSELKTLKTDLLEFKPDLQEAAKRFQEQILDIGDKEITAPPKSTATRNTATEKTTAESTTTGMPENEAAAEKAAAAGNADVPPMESQPEEQNFQP